jgi:hypothetical protein
LPTGSARSPICAALPFDAAWWWSIDPASALFTSGVFRPFPSDHAICGGLHSNEFGDTDYNKFRVLARAAGKAGVLSAATGGQAPQPAASWNAATAISTCWPR